MTLDGTLANLGRSGNDPASQVEILMQYPPLFSTSSNAFLTLSNNSTHHHFITPSLPSSLSPLLTTAQQGVEDCGLTLPSSPCQPMTSTAQVKRRQPNVKRSSRQDQDQGTPRTQDTTIGSILERRDNMTGLRQSDGHSRPILFGHHISAFPTHSNRPATGLYQL